MEQTLDDKVLAARVAQVVKQESAGRLQWVYLSFADEQGGFLGAAIVEARGVVSASRTARLHGCNPGGEMRCEDYPERTVPPAWARYRLLDRVDVKRLFPT